MKRIGQLAAFIIFGSMLAAGCNNISHWFQDTPPEPLPAELVHIAAPTDFVGRGGYIYDQYCAACHGPNGIGRTAYFPNLRANPFVAAAPESAARIVLHGHALMPPFRDQLTDEDVAAVITFIRTTWNNEEDRMSPEAVQPLRWER